MMLFRLISGPCLLLAIAAGSAPEEGASMLPGPPAPSPSDRKPSGSAPSVRRLRSEDTSDRTPGEYCWESHRCREWASEGECEDNPTYMYRCCYPACHDEDSGDPRDANHCWERSRCWDWAREGECDDNSNYMYRCCGRECEHWDPPSDPRYCRELHRCGGWAQEGECRQNPKYMYRCCKDWCNFRV